MKICRGYYKRFINKLQVFLITLTSHRENYFLPSKKGPYMIRRENKLWWCDLNSFAEYKLPPFCLAGG